MAAASTLRGNNEDEKYIYTHEVKHIQFLLHTPFSLTHTHTYFPLPLPFPPSLSLPLSSSFIADMKNDQHEFPVRVLYCDANAVQLTLTHVNSTLR